MPPHGYRSIEASQRAHVNLEKVTAASTTTRSTKKRRKHSPTNLFTQEEVSRHDTLDDCWVIYNGFVYLADNDHVLLFEVSPASISLIGDFTSSGVSERSGH